MDQFIEKQSFIQFYSEVETEQIMQLRENTVIYLTKT